jgi:hypothetical protein
MCGVNDIFAYHATSKQPDEAELLATRDAMRARGPDGSWWSADRRCGLGIDDCNDGWTFRFTTQVRALLAAGRISRDAELFDARDNREMREPDRPRDAVVR